MIGIGRTSLQWISASVATLLNPMSPALMLEMENGCKVNQHSIAVHVDLP